MKFASIGLCVDPKHQKLRFRRMQARRAVGFHQQALSDAKVILRQSTSSEAKDNIADLAQIRIEIKQLQQLIDNRPKDLRDTNITTDAFFSDEEDEWPVEGDIHLTNDNGEFEPENDWTDFEENARDSNGVPCRFHNRRSGCAKGNACKFSHARDELSVRDLM
jgi:hypothetical protein